MGFGKWYQKFLMKPKEHTRKGNPFRARGYGGLKIVSSVIVIPVVTAMGIVGGPFGVAGMAVASTVCMVPIICWGVGDLLIPELIYIECNSRTVHPYD